MNESVMESSVSTDYDGKKRKERDLRMTLAVNYFSDNKRREIPYEIAGRIMNFNDYFDNNNGNFKYDFKDAFSNESGSNNYDQVMSCVESKLAEYTLGIVELLKLYDNVKYVYTFGFSQIIGRLFYNIEMHLGYKIHLIDLNKYDLYGDENEYEIIFSEKNNYYTIRNLLSKTGPLCHKTQDINQYCQKIARQFIPGYDKLSGYLQIVRSNVTLEIPIDDYVFKKFNYVSADILAEVNFLSITILKKMFDYEMNVKLASLDDAMLIIHCIYLNLKLPNYIRWECTKEGTLKFSLLTGSKVYEFDNKTYSIDIPKECSDYIWERMSQYDYEKPERPVNHKELKLEERLASFVKKPL